MQYLNFILFLVMLSNCSSKNLKCVLDNRCPNPNEIVTNCGPFDECEATCRNPYAIGVACPEICVQKCVCRDGFVRDDNLVCVERDLCSIDCNENEEYLHCGSGCGDLTCENPSYANMMCPMFCNQRCFCVEGYVRDEGGKCIPQSDCEMNCPANEHFTRCGAACEPTCENQHRNKLICPFICLKGCICDEGFVRSNGNCIRASTCPNECGTHQTFNECGPHVNCVATCRKPFAANGPCPASCNPGCFCDEGYVRKQNQECAPLEKCSNDECDENEEYKQCGSPCQPTCEEQEEMACMAKCEPGCFCKKGFVRDSNGKCVDKRQCPRVASKCDEPNEIYDECGSACGDYTCETYGKPRICTKNCSPGCFCQESYVRYKGECKFYKVCET